MGVKENIRRKIHEFKGYRIIFDFDLSELYDVETRVLKQAVRRNIHRFPDDFLIELSIEEWKELITSCDKLPVTVKHNPAPPFAFTELWKGLHNSVYVIKKIM